jgi:hypothetical protein
MAVNDTEIQRRKQLAVESIRRTFGTDEGEYGATLFVTHHLEELPGDYWQKHLGSDSPEPSKVLGLLQLRGHWGDGDEDGIDVFDFTLPGEVTNYVLSVRFDGSGEIEEISMES